MKKAFILILLINTIVSQAFAVKKRVLFIGNSYTYVNNLPQMLKDAAASTNDTVEYDSHTIGGYTLQQHASNTTTISKIMQGNWDYVVLQEQSQLPAFPMTQVETDVFPYAKKLDSLIRHYNNCAETIFYMTWGYKTGDAGNCPNYPPVCTYQGMDSLLRIRYMMMADSNDAIVSPVGAVRRYLRSNYPAMELYDTDGSHPSLAGTYAAACSFYSVIFRKNPLNITYNSTLTSTEASNIRTATKAVVFDSIATWHVGAYDPDAQFSYNMTGNNVSFSNQSAYAIHYHWSFGDGNTSSLVNPMHTYSSSGNYNVRLIAQSCNRSDTNNMSINVNVTAVSDVWGAEIVLFPNPVKEVLTIQIPLYLLQQVSLFNGYGTPLFININTREPNELYADLSHCPPGVYFIKMIVGGKEEVRKISKL